MSVEIFHGNLRQHFFEFASNTVSRHRRSAQVLLTIALLVSERAFFAVFSALGGSRITSILVPRMLKHKHRFQANSIVDTVALGSLILPPFSV